MSVSELLYGNKIYVFNKRDNSRQQNTVFKKLVML